MRLDDDMDQMSMFSTQSFSEFRLHLPWRVVLIALNTVIVVLGLTGKHLENSNVQLVRCIKYIIHSYSFMTTKEAQRL